MTRRLVCDRAKPDEELCGTAASSSAVTETLAAMIRARLARRAAERDATDSAPVEVAHDALCLDAGWTGWFGLRPDGEVIFVPHDQDPSTAPTDVHAIDPRSWLAGLVAGARTYPELAILLPARTSGDVACGACDGTGELLGAICGVCS